jgi:hypothetical protein
LSAVAQLEDDGKKAEAHDTRDKSEGDKGDKGDKADKQVVPASSPVTN